MSIVSPRKGGGRTGTNPAASDQSVQSIESVRRKGRMEQVIESLATGLSNGVAWLAENGILFGIFAIIWIAFAVGLIWSQGSLDQAWNAIRGLPLIVQVVVWLLFLPVMIGLWIWETSWPLIVRLVLVVGVAGWNLLMFLPKALQAARP
jgi:ABC-type amino acid transport system permease subunit